MNSLKERVAVIGATGYVGGRLVPLLLQEGYTVRAIGRSLKKLKNKPWSNNKNIELHAANILDEDSITKALNGCNYAYYLVHSMNPGTKDFAKSDQYSAQNMIAAAEKNNLKRIIYLGGLGEENENLSKHLKSRSEVGKILQSGTVPVTVLKAAMIIGSGSASFEILRYLVDRLPIMITPKWVNVPNQPISIRNVLNYLIGCLGNKETSGKTFDIGGKDIVTYKELFKIYEEEADLNKRFIISVPVFTPRLSSYWIHLITPLPSYIAMPLAEGLKNPVICRENKIKELIPQNLLSCREAIKIAVKDIEKLKVESSWTDSGIIEHPEWNIDGDEKWAGGTVYKDKRETIINATPEEIWKPIIKIGGENGYYYGNWMWEIRGFLDIVFGGTGLKRGRKHPENLEVGDVLDFWRVVEIIPNKKLLLFAEMKVPGKAFLQFEVHDIGNMTCKITQTATFFPKGIEGILYWYVVTPFHNFVFNGMLKGIVKAIQK